MKHRAELIFLVLLAMAFGLSSCKENSNPPPQAKTETKEVKKEDAEPEPPVIGRLAFMEKNVFRFLPEEKDWSLAMVDVPVGDGDIFYSDTQGRSEVTFPNDSKIRINDKSKIQVDQVKSNQTSVFVNSGVARIQNRGAENTVKVDTPYGQVLAKQPASFDVYVGDSSVAVTAFKQGVEFVDSKGNHYEVKPDGDSLVANDNAVTSSSRFLDSRWDSWNNERDSESKLWEENPSPYLPADLKSETKVLADNGNWEQLNYNGETAQYWTPRNVGPEWSPFTVGQWTTWSGEQLWVPYERFGWVTHHHGGWIHFNNRWYWRPPVHAGWRYRYSPWYPARVAWVNHGRYIGWAPLSPYEAYYGRRYWGPRSVVYYNNMRHVEIHRYVNINRVVVVDKDRLYGVHRRYETTRDVRVVKDVISNGRHEPVVTRDVVKGADLRAERQFARSGDMSRKPSGDATNELASRRGGRGTQTVQGSGDGIQKASLRPADVKGGQSSLTKSGDSRNLPSTPRDIRRDERQERRLETKGEGTKQASIQQQQQQKQQQPMDRRQQQQQDQQQRQQQQLQQRQQQQQQQQQQMQARQQQQQQQMQARQQQQQQQMQARQQQQAERFQQQQAQRLQQEQHQAMQRQQQQQQQRQQAQPRQGKQPHQ